MSITIPDPWLMLLVFVVFLITMLLLNLWLFKPLIGYMDERENSLRSHMESAASDDSEVQVIQDKIKTVLAEARVQASRIVEQAFAEAKSDYDAKIEKKNDEIQARMETFRSDLEAQKIQIRQELLADLGGFESVLRAKIQQI